VRPGDLGVDAMHINLHKTFSTPHGGGGPGAGPVALSAALAPFMPVPYTVVDADGLRYVERVGSPSPHSSSEWGEGRGEGRPHTPEQASAPHPNPLPAEERGEGIPLGRMCAFHGQMGMFVRALAYMMSHGGDGLRQVANDAVLNANYLMASLKDDMTPAFEGPCMHEALFDDDFLKDTDVSTLDIAKAMIDEGYHPMTMYFPLVVHGALLIEPTETESKDSLDQFIGVMKGLARRAKSGDTGYFHAAPTLTPRRRLDETAAARKPVLRWKPSPITGEAAE
jgi:glycine dehydrogenase subunit 2